MIICSLRFFLFLPGSSLADAKWPLSKIKTVAAPRRRREMKNVRLTRSEEERLGLPSNYALQIFTTLTPVKFKKCSTRIKDAVGELGGRTMEKWRAWEEMTPFLNWIFALHSTFRVRVVSCFVPSGSRRHG